MPADSYSIGISDTHLRGLINRRFRAHYYLLDVSVIDGFGTSHYGHCGVVQHRVPLQQKEEMRRSEDLCRTLRRTAHLSCGVGVVEFQWIRPEYSRQSGSFFVVRRQVQSERTLDAISALVSNQLLLDSAQLRRWIGKPRK